MTKEQENNKDQFVPGDMLMIYETRNGWRYRIGRRDDGNYPSAKEAFTCAAVYLADKDRGDRVVAA